MFVSQCFGCRVGWLVEVGRSVQLATSSAAVRLLGTSSQLSEFVWYEFDSESVGQSVGQSVG